MKMNFRVTICGYILNNFNGFLFRYWNTLLTFIKERGGYCGAPMLDDLFDFRDVVARFDMLNLRKYCTVN